MEPIRYGELRRDGLSRGQIRGRLAGGTLHRVARGAYTTGTGRPSLVDALHALFLILPASAVLGFHTAAQLYGFGVVPSRLPHVVVPAGTGLPDIQGVAAHQAVLPLGDPVMIAGLPCAPPNRAAIDLARTCSRLDALAVLEAALRSGRCTCQSLAEELGRHDGLRGVRQARYALPLVGAR